MGQIKYRLSPTGILAVIILGIVLLFFVLSAIITALNYKTYYTCSELKKAGYTNIKTGSKYYQASMDRNHNGVACE